MVGDPIPGMAFSDAIGWYWPESREQFLTHRLADRSNELEAARKEIAKLKAERLKLDRRIHNQRKALRETWEIVEMRGNWIGSPAARRKYANLLKRHQALLASTTALKAGE